MNNEMNGSKKNEIIEVQNRIDSVMTKKSESKVTMIMMMIMGKN